jgi:MATE family multidrug resistance protein
VLLLAELPKVGWVTSAALQAHALPRMQAIYEPLKKYLQCQGIVKPVMYIALLDNILSIGANWFFIYFLDMGYWGVCVNCLSQYVMKELIGLLLYDAIVAHSHWQAPIARGLVQWLLVFSTLFYMQTMNVGWETWGGWSAEALSDWGNFLSLALPGLVMCVRPLCSPRE